ncbi:MAG: amino acid adenylation domain-containing protein, partial [bacterium]|nr:amino acid adenylation domain-containing protein [bacterium]
TILTAEIHKGFNVEIVLGEFFKQPTIRGLARYITSAGEDIYTVIKPVEEKEYYPLSSAQMRLFIIRQLDPESTAYNMPSAMVLAGEPDVRRLENAFRRLVRRHESFRTSFQTVDRVPVQRVHDDVEFSILVTGEGRGEVSSPEGIETVIRHFITPFDLSRAPLLRVELFKMEESKYLLMVDMHHIISDGISIRIMLEEFGRIYRGEEPAPLQLRYKDFAGWQNSESARLKVKLQQEFWLNRFSGEIPVLNLAVDYPRPAVQDFEGRISCFEVGEEEAVALNRLGLEHGATLFMVLTAVFNVFLSRFSGQEDIVIGTPTAGRSHAELQRVIGMFVNTLALRNFPEGGKTFDEFILDVRRRTLEAFENQDLQFEDLVEKVVVNRDAGRSPLFDVMFALQNMGEDTGGAEPGDSALNVREYEFEKRVSRFDMTWNTLERDNRLFVEIEYCTRLFKEETIERFAVFFKNIVVAVTAAPGTLISELDIIPEEEKRQLLVEFNDTATEYPGEKTIHQLFAEQAVRTPDGIAIIDYRSYKTHMTYDQLNQKSDRSAHRLIGKGVALGDIVGIKLERSIEMIIGILGILKAGAAYLPIDPEYPQDRIDYMVADSNADIVLYLTPPTLRAPLSRGDLRWESARAPVKSPLERGTPKGGGVSTLAHSPENLAYIIYTSGSTGKPKGVMIEHRALVNRLNWMQKKYPVGTGDTILHKTPFTFDVSVWEISWWSIVGARVCLLAPGGEKDPRLIVETIHENRVTVMHFVPSMLSVFLEYVKESGKESIKKLVSLKQVIASGEALTVSQVETFNRLLARTNGTALANLYGPTEAAIDVSYYDCPKDGKIERVPIGKPIDNIQLTVLGMGGHLQPVGVAGELCISGAGLARGYLNNPELTLEKFFPSTLLYHTGDLARFLPDGSIEFLGRIDHQVKIRGFRIELGEIEAVLGRHPRIKETVVTTVADPSGESSLCAYIAGKKDLTVEQLREYLEKELPGYMIPPYFVPIAKVPLTANGKVDRKSLPAPEKTIQTGTRYQAPTNPVEEKLVSIWQNILKVEKIGIFDSFFSLGGHSLRVMNLAARIRKSFRVDIPLRYIFDNPTIAQIAGMIREKEEKRKRFEQILSEIERLNDNQIRELLK